MNSLFTIHTITFSSIFPLLQLSSIVLKKCLIGEVQIFIFQFLNGNFSLDLIDYSSVCIIIKISIFTDSIFYIFLKSLLMLIILVCAFYYLHTSSVVSSLVLRLGFQGQTKFQKQFHLINEFIKVTWKKARCKKYLYSCKLTKKFGQLQ